MKKLSDNQKAKGLMIRNSTAEFLMFTADSRQDGLEVRFQDETVWLTQKMMAELFQCSTDNISLHLKNIFKDGELEEKSVTEEFSATASDGKQYRTKHYNLDAIIAIGNASIHGRLISDFDREVKKMLSATEGTEVTEE